LFPQTYPSKVLDKLEVRGSRLEAGKHRRAVAKGKPSLFSLLERARSLCFEGVTGCSNWLNFAIRFWRLEAGGSALETPERQILPAKSGALATSPSSFRSVLHLYSLHYGATATLQLDGRLVGGVACRMALRPGCFSEHAVEVSVKSPKH
jgi:hypothetical protein